MGSLVADAPVKDGEMIVGIDAYEMPASMTFAHSTRMADSWQALPECIVQRAMTVGPAGVQVSIFEGNTDDLKPRARTRNPIKQMKRSLTIDRRNDYIFDARYEIDSNVGHYIVDTIPKVLVAREALSRMEGRDVEVHVVLMEASSAMSREAFKAFGIPTIATEAKVFGKLVKIVPRSPETYMAGQLLHSTAPVMCGSLTDLYSDFREELVSHGDPASDKIYISRRDTRTVENEAEVAHFLEARGYRKYLFESGELSLVDQWRAVAGASRIVAIHGAGMTPLILNGRGLAHAPGDLSGLRVVELYGAGYYVDFNRRLAALVNAHWCGVRGRITPDVVRDMDERGGGRLHQSSSFHVDLEALELALDYSDRCGSDQNSGIMQ